jgi:hypothetical protein
VNGGYVTPMLLITGISEANHFYNTGTIDIRILVAGGIATGLLGLFSNIPGFGPVAAGIAWVGVAGALIAPIQNPSPAQNLLKITGSL